MVVGVSGRALHTRVRDGCEAGKETSTPHHLEQPTSTSQTLLLPKQHGWLGVRCSYTCGDMVHSTNRVTIFHAPLLVKFLYGYLPVKMLSNICFVFLL